MTHVNLLSLGIAEVIVESEVRCDERMPHVVGCRYDANQFRQFAIAQFDHLSEGGHLTYDYYLAICEDETILILRPTRYVRQIMDGYWIVRSYDDAIRRTEGVYEDRADAYGLFHDLCYEDHEGVSVIHVILDSVIPEDTITYSCHDLTD